jgi:hypothetical protein
VSGVASPLTAGPFWSWLVPALVFGIALGATWLLYRHFADGQTTP